MTILVTGATSGLGRNAVDILCVQGASLRATGRNTEVGQALKKQGAQFFAADLTALSAADMKPLLRGVTTVWHCAALSAPWGAPANFKAINATATEKLIQAAVAAGVSHFVHVSTPSLYFDYRHQRNVPEHYRARHYANDYVRSKAMAETILSRYARQHPDTVFVILRPRALFGAHDRVLMPRVLKMIQGRGQLSLPRGGQAFMDMTFTPNAVLAMQLASRCPAHLSGQAFNITNHEPRPLGQVLDQLFRRELGRPLHLRSVPYRLASLAARGMTCWSGLTGREPAYTRYSVGALNYDMTLDNARAIETLGYRPAYTMDEGIRQTAQWVHEHGQY